MYFCRLLISFQNQLLRKIISGISLTSEGHTICIQTRPDILTGLVWVQTVAKLSADDTRGQRAQAIHDKNH